MVIIISPHLLICSPQAFFVYKCSTPCLAYLRFVTKIDTSLAETIAVKMENLQKTIANVQGRSLAFSYTVGRAYGERGERQSQERHAEGCKREG